MPHRSGPPILDHDIEAASVFLPRNLLASARHQKGLPPRSVPKGCLLDFDGELVEHLVARGRAQPDPTWPCFHTRLHRWTSRGGELGIIGGVIGAPFAVLVAEELFACGCRALVSIGSAGLVAAEPAPPFFLLIERALRDEGTSYHYAPPAPFAEADRNALDEVCHSLDRAGLPVVRGTTWTTDAPFRETARAVAERRQQGITAVEMEAAALLAFAAFHGRTVVCLSQVTNQMATGANDFDKGGQTGQEQALDVCEETLWALLSTSPSKGAEQWA